MAQGTPNEQWDISEHIKSCSEHKGRGREGRVIFEVMVVVLPSNCSAWWIPALLEVAQHLLMEEVN